MVCNSSEATARADSFDARLHENNLVKKAHTILRKEHILKEQLQNLMIKA